MPAPDVSAYLARLGVPAEAPSVRALTDLHRAHVSRVPYETLWLQQDLDWDIAPEASFSRIARTGRSGYCFHLNGAFAVLLRELGYVVTLHAGAVHRQPEVEASAFGNHMVLQVHELPDTTSPAGVWYVDVGLGDGPLEPMPLACGTYRQAGMEYELQEAQADHAAFRLTNDPAGGFRYMTWLNEPVTIDRFAASHAQLSASPESPFRRVPTIQVRVESGARVLRGRTLREIGTPSSQRLLNDRDDLAETLESGFGLDVSSLGPGTLDHLWDRCQESHAAWEAEQRAL